MEFVDILMSLFGYERVKANDDQLAKADTSPKVIYKKRGAEYLHPPKDYGLSKEARRSAWSHLSDIFSNFWEAVADVMRPTSMVGKRSRVPAPATDSVLTFTVAAPHAGTRINPIVVESEKNTLVPEPVSPHRKTVQILVNLYKKNPEDSFNGTDEFKTWAKQEHQRTKTEGYEGLTAEEIATLEKYLILAGQLKPEPKTEPKVEQKLEEKTEPAIHHSSQSHVLESDNDIDNQTPAKLPGQLEFEEFLLQIFELENRRDQAHNKEWIFSNECYLYADVVRRQILSEKNNGFSADEELKLDAAGIVQFRYSLSEAQKTERVKLEQESAERKAKAQARAQLPAGQADFEEYLESYKAAATQEREMSFYKAGKFFSPEVLAYADGKRDQVSIKNAVNDLFKAAESFGKWPPATESSKKSLSATSPPPPSPPAPRSLAANQGLNLQRGSNSGEQIIAAMSKLVSELSGNVRLIAHHADLSNAKIWYALEGLMLAAEHQIDMRSLSDPIKSAWDATKKTIIDGSRKEDSDFYEITNSEEKLRAAETLIAQLKTLRSSQGQYANSGLPQWGISLEDVAAELMVKNALEAALSEASRPYDFSLKDVSALSDEEMVEAQRQFSDSVDAFNRHENRGDSQSFFASREAVQYLNVLCLSYASHISDIYGKSPGLVAKDQEALKVAGLLLNEFHKRKAQATTLG